jgi:hypothetical protein
VSEKPPWSVRFGLVLWCSSCRNSPRLVLVAQATTLLPIEAQHRQARIFQVLHNKYVEVEGLRGSPEDRYASLLRATKEQDLK